MFNPKRLELARKRRSLTKKKISEKLNLSIQTLSEWEAGNTVPKFENAVELSRVLDFPIEFFYNEATHNIELDKVSFRALTKMKAYQRDTALACGELALILNEWIETKFELPRIDIPEFAGKEPEQAALLLREEWNIEEDYIENAIYLLEKHGVRVYSMSEDCRDFDAFSTWYDEKPFVFLNTKKSAERSRFDAMHELGHLVLHYSCSFRDKKIEDEANMFASCMLMPKESILEFKYIEPTIENFIELKENWKVSLKALIYRYNQLGLLSEWINRVLNIDMNKRGHNVNEPSPIERETSYILSKIFEVLKEDNIYVRDIVNEIHIPSSEINNMTFNIFPLNNNNITVLRESKTKLSLVDD